MRLVPIELIKVPANRQRREFPPEGLVTLADSIKGPAGLLHALVVQEGTGELVTGERRLRAIRDFVYGFGKTFTYNGEAVPSGMVPVVITQHTDPLTLEEIELDENIRREDLTWAERAAAESRLHRIRAERNPEQTLADTAAEVAEATGVLPVVARDNLRQSIVVTRLMDSLPGLAGAKTLKDAFKLVQRHEETLRNERLATSVGSNFSSASHRAFHANCLDWMAQEEWAGKFDVICTDPPYGMGADTFGDGAGRLLSIEHHYRDDYESWAKMIRKWTALSAIVTKPQAHAYVWCDFDRFHELKNAMERAGWYVFRTPLVNFKRNSGRVPLPDKGPRRQYEICLYAIKGDKLTTAIYPDVIETDADEQMGHGAQKPVALYVDLLRRSCRPGDLVLDSFSGSGTIFPACHQLKLYAVGVEAEAASYGKGLERLKELS